MKGVKLNGRFNGFEGDLCTLISLQWAGSSAWGQGIQRSWLPDIEILSTWPDGLPALVGSLGGRTEQVNLQIWSNDALFTA